MYGVSFVNKFKRVTLWQRMYMVLKFDLWSYLRIKELTKPAELSNAEIQTGYFDP